MNMKAYEHNFIQFLLWGVQDGEWGIGLGCKRTMDMKASENNFFFGAVHPFCISIPFDPFDIISIYSILLLMDGTQYVWADVDRHFVVVHFDIFIF